MLPIETLAASMLQDALANLASEGITPKTTAEPYYKALDLYGGISIAISLKRIADGMTRNTRAFYYLEYICDNMPNYTQAIKDDPIFKEALDFVTTESVPQAKP